MGLLLIFFSFQFFLDRRYTIPTNGQIVISLAKTGCLGSCPVYELTIYENGTVVYEGRMFVGARGVRKTNIGEKKVRQLAAELESAGYFSLQDEYNQQTYTDSASATTYVKIGDKQKRISHYYGDVGAPESLFLVEKAIDEAANSERWVRACAFRYPRYCKGSLPFWIACAAPLGIALLIAMPFIRQRKTFLGIMRGQGIIVLIWAPLLLLANSGGDLFGITSYQAVRFYGILSFIEFVILIPIGLFLTRQMNSST